MSSARVRLRTTRLFADPKARALPLICLFLDAFGSEGEKGGACLGWSPTTICLEIRDEFSLQPHAACIRRLMGAIALLTTDGFRTSLPDFVSISLALCGQPPGAVADADDCAIGLADASLIDPPENAREEGGGFSEEIRAYLGEILDREAILVPPDVYRLATNDRGALADRVRHDFADDPEMLETVEVNAGDNTERINRITAIHVKESLRQLQELPLATGDARRVASRLLEGLADVALEGEETSG